MFLSALPSPLLPARLAPVLALLCLFLFARSACANTLNVPTQYATIQAAINASVSGDTVLISDGTYTGPGNVGLDFAGKNITVTSQNGASAAIIDCQGSAIANHRGFYLHSGETSAVISGLTIQNGYQNGGFYAGAGGGISAFNVGVTIQNCVLKNNTAIYGGGVYLNTSGPAITVTNCTLTGNAAVTNSGYGGGAYNYCGGGGTLTVAQCTLSANTANFGGGLYDDTSGGTLSVSGCTLTGNTSGNRGGGINNYNYSGSLSVTNCLVTGNASSYGGGGIDNEAYAGSIAVTNCTLTGNSASGGSGSGIGVEKANAADTGPITLTNDLLYGDVGGEYASASGSVTVTNCDIQGGYAGTGDIDADPLFFNPPTDLHLKYGSPCLGAGTQRGAPTSTLDGRARPYQPSIGAYEVEPGSRAATILVTSSLNPSAFGQPITFTAQVSGAGGPPTGGITFFLDGAALITSPLFSGSASYRHIAMAGGTHTIVAAYSGDASFAPGSSPAYTQTVSRVGSTTTLTSSLSPSPAGQQVTFTAGVSGAGGTPTGVITFSMDGVAQASTSLSNGSAAYVTSTLLPGSRTLTAAYAGDAAFAPSASPALTQTVNAAVATTTALTSSPNPSVFGQSVTFTMTVTGHSPSGAVTLTDTTTGATLGTGSTSNAGSPLSFTVSGLSGGAHQIVASYGGDIGNAASTSPPLTQTVAPAATTTALTSSLNPSIATGVVTFTATVAGSGAQPTGAVVFTVDGAAQPPIALTGGAAAYATSALAVGTHTVMAAYGGGVNFAPSASPPLTQTVIAHVAPQYVSPTGSDGNPGTQASPKLTLQAAISATVSGDAVIVEDGTYTGPGDVDLDFGGRGITVTSQNGAARTTIDCAASPPAQHRGFILQSGEVGAAIRGLTIQNGYVGGNGGGGSGGGIYAPNASLTVQNCVLLNNTAAYGSGGGLYASSGYPYTNRGGAVTVTNCVFSGNTASGGGGIYGGNPYGAPLTVTNCTFTGNTARYGAGLVNASYPAVGMVVLTNDVFYGDTGSEINEEGNGTSNAVVLNCDVQGGYPGTNVLNADPLFFGPADLRLKPGSPCLGAGTPSGAPATTLDGMTRPNPPSIGAYEGVPLGTAPTTTTVTSSLNPSTFGQSVTLTAAVTGGGGTPTGTVTFTVDGVAQPGATLSGGAASCVTSALAVGPHTLTAAYGGDPTFAPGTSAPLTQTVSLAQTTTALTSNANPFPFGFPITFTATVTGQSPTGAVTFTDTTSGTALGTATLSGGAAGVFVFLAGGVHQIIAAYGGDAANAPSASPALAQTVSRAESYVRLDSSSNPSDVGKSVNVTATVRGGGVLPAGTVVFTVDGVAQAPVPLLAYQGNLAQAVYATPSLPPGPHVISAAYGGDGNLAPGASDPLTQVVLIGTAITVANVSGSAGQTVTLSAVLKTAAGVALAGRTPQFVVDNVVAGTAVTNSGGVAVLRYTLPAALSVGGHTLFVILNGSGDYAAAVGIGTLTVTPASTTLSLSASSGAPGQTVPLKATLKRTTGGAAVSGETVTFSVDGAAVGTAVTTGAGLASLSYTLPAGSAIGSSHPVTAAFAGSGSLSASSGASTLTVSKYATSLSVTTVSGTPGQTVTLSATLKSGTAALSGKTVSFTVDGAAVGMGTTNTAGLATLAYAIPANAPLGSHPVTAAFTGDASYAAATGKGVLSVKSATALSVSNASGAHGTGVTLTAVLTAGGAASSGKTVTFKVDGKAVGTAVTDGAGAASLPYAIPAASKLGGHPVSASFAGDAADTPAAGAGTLTVS